MAETEEYFPRGGKKPTNIQFKQTGNFLGAPEKAEKKKKNRTKKKSEADDGYLSDEGTQHVESVKNCAVGLHYKMIKPGVLLLGRVQRVSETKITVALPSKMRGTIMGCHICEPYNKLLEAYVNDKITNVKQLSDMFRLGQYIVVKVLENEDNDLMLSMMPQHVNSVINHKELHNGALLQAAVVSVEDHGYVMDIGIPNTRAFLPKAQSNSEFELDTGFVTWCTIKSITPSPDNCVVALTNSLQALQAGVQRRPSTGLLPATAVEFIVDKPLDNGIEGHIFKDTTAYIQRFHAEKVKGKKPTLGQKIRARVLYVMPITNTPFLTMKNIFETTFPNLEEEQKLKEGDIIENAKVLKIQGRSIHFKLGKGSTGLMGLRRVQVDEDFTDEEIIAKSYPTGSEHRVRILSYYLCDYVYAVSDEATVLSQKHFSLEELKVGDVVSAVIKDVDPKKITLTIGRCTGIVPYTHWTDAGVCVDPKKASTNKLVKKFKVGQTVTARVVMLDPVKNHVYLTMKPALLSPKLNTLHSYEQAEVGKAYTGTVKFVRNYLMVSFFNNVSAVVPNKYVTRDATPNTTYADAFHIGQIVTCTIVKVDVENKKLKASLTTQPFAPEEKREKAKRKTNDGTESPKKKKKLDDNSESEQEEKAITKKNNKISNNVEQEETSEESDAIGTDIEEENEEKEKDTGQIKTYERLKVGEIVTGVIKSIDPRRIVVTVGKVKGFVPYTHWTDAGVCVDPEKAATNKLIKKFKEGQPLKLRVVLVDVTRGNVYLTMKPALLSPTLHTLHSYEEAEVGETYTGTIKYIRDFLLVSFFNNVIAVVPHKYVTSDDTFQLGQIVNCTIIKVDVENKKMTGSLTLASSTNNNTESPKKKKKHDSHSESEKEEKPTTKKKSKILNNVEQEETSEESDAIDTDIEEEYEEKEKDTGKIKTYERLKVGEIVTGVVKSIDPRRIVVTVGKVKGFVPYTHWTDTGVCVDPEKAETNKLIKKFKEGQKLKLRVVLVDMTRGNVYLTMKPALLSPTLHTLHSYEEAKVGETYTGTIKYIRDFLLVSFFNNVIAVVPHKYVTSDVTLTSFSDTFQLGQIVNCTIIKVDVENKKMTGSLTLAPLTNNNTEPPKKKKKHDSHSESEPEEKATTKKNNKMLKNVEIKETSDESDAIDTDLDESDEEKETRQMKVYERLKIGEIVTGVVKSIDPKKIVVTVGKVNGIVPYTHWTDAGVCVDPEKAETNKLIKKFKEGQSLKLRVVLVNVTRGHVYLTMKPALLSPTLHTLHSYEEAEVGKAYTGTVKYIRDFLLISFFNNVIAFVPHKYVANDVTPTSFSDAFQLGQIVSCTIMKVDVENKKMTGSLITEPFERVERKASKRRNENSETEKISKRRKKNNDTESEEKNKKKDKKSKDKAKKEKSSKELITKQKKDKKAKIEITSKDDLKEEKKKKNVAIAVVDSLEPVLDMPSVKEFWSAGTEEPSKVVDNEESSSSEDEQQEQPKKKRKKLTIAEKVAKAREEEDRVREMERRATESDNQPRSSDQFERALLASPDSSQLWIAYMAFHLQATEIEKARAVARKALNTISFREEEEKLNVWLAIINCENRFGTKESQQKVLEEALQMNEPFKVHSKLLDIYVDTSKPTELIALVDLMLRKYKREPSMYTLCGAACFKLNLVDKARHVMQKAVSVLDKKEHVQVLVQFALMERSAGEKERAEALFEQILAVYPQRVDVCSTYIDMLVKSSDVEQARQVLERMTAQNLPARKMKILYRKWVELEEKFGSPEAVERIQQKALEYINNAKF